MICPYRNICSGNITKSCIEDDGVIPLCSERIKIKQKKKLREISIKRILKKHDENWGK